MIIFLITLLGLVLRLILSNQSFWLDEGASIMIASAPLNQLIDAIKPDFHPPVFYGLLHFWLPIAGKSESIIRLPFIFLATATIPALYFLTQEVFGKKNEIPLISALFLALNPLHIYYSQELRMYSLVTLFIVFSWLFLIRKNYFAAAILNILSIFTFYGAIFSILAQVVYLFSKRSKRREYLLLSLPVLIAFIAWLPIFSIQLKNGEYLKNALPGWQILSGSLTVKSLFLLPLKFIFGRISLSPDRMYYLVGGFLTFIFGIITLRSYAIKKSLPLWIALLVPVIIASIMSLKTPVLGYWRLIFLLPFFMALLAAGVHLLPKTTKIATIIWIAGVFLFFNLFFWVNPKFHREDWKGLFELVSGKNAVIVIPFPQIFAPLTFYLADAEYLIAQDRLGHNREDLGAEIEKKVQIYSNFYVLEYLADLTDPDREILDTVRDAGLREMEVYNLNNLGQVRLFQKYENSN